jgi:hypothetical protein
MYPMAEDRGGTRFSTARAGRPSLRAIIAIASVAHKSSKDGFALKPLNRNVQLWPL